MIDYGPLAESLLQTVVTGKIWPNVIKRRGPFVSEHKFNFSKLDRLKPRGGFESVAKAGEGRRSHRLKNVYLCIQRVHDGPSAFEGMNRAEEIVCGRVLLKFCKLVR